MAELDLAVERQRTDPDVVVYAPASITREATDTGNEHFLVFQTPRGEHAAVWTQSSWEGAGNHRIVIAHSPDQGRTWEAPRTIAGNYRRGEGLQASWGFPIPSASGRLYLFWNQYQGVDDVHHQFTGTLDVAVSDDDGRTFSPPVTLPMPRSAHDHPDATVPANWIVWQKPGQDSHGRWLTGFTRWTSRAVRPEPPDGGWWGSWDSAAEFMRFDNLDEGPDPGDIAISWPQVAGGRLTVPYPGHPAVSVAQEPSWVVLPDGRLFCTLRTFTGQIWYTVSEDDGGHWREPEPLLRADGGEPLRQPLCCCPIYSFSDGLFVLLYHNNDGHFEQYLPRDTSFNRRPAYVAVGRFAPRAHQPLAFGPTRLLMDNGGVPLLENLKRTDVAVYTSVTEHEGRRMLWYPDRKFFLLGKELTDEVLGL